MQSSDTQACEWEGEEEVKVTNEMIPLIEKALGFTLYDWQRAYLMDEPHVKPIERASGRTTAYVVKLLLTNREPINIKFEAMKYKDYHSVHYTGLFRNFMREIDEKLTSVGLPTCSVKPKPIRDISIDVNVATDNLQLKLRAIAKHTAALADELDAIDNEWRCDCGCTRYVDESLINSGTDEVVCAKRICNECGEAYVIDDKLEGTD